MHTHNTYTHNTYTHNTYTHAQLGPKETVATDLLREKWHHVGCAQSKLDELLA